jgi:hypothetical protein
MPPKSTDIFLVPAVLAGDVLGGRDMMWLLAQRKIVVPASKKMIDSLFLLHAKFFNAIQWRDSILRLIKLQSPRWQAD